MTIQIAFRDSKEAHRKIEEEAKQQKRSMSNLLKIMVGEQMKRIEAEGFDSIFYKGKK